MQNHLRNQTSPYLLQHAGNPVEWYPWCDEAFIRAKEEDKPVFLSIGYSTCHWCHVMAHESFEDMEVADILNRYFISIKVDKEERPDIDSIYMSVCQAFTGSGGWPTTIFLTPDQKPFFAGTYFPKKARYGQVGFIDLLQAVHEKWETDRTELLQSADELVSHLKVQETTAGTINPQHIKQALAQYKYLFDEKNGGFGRAPKFPTPHNLLFLLQQYEKKGDAEALKMVEKTLYQMYRGGIFDHIGGGFSRYSTDERFLVPHFEKMLYDNALLIITYCKAFHLTGKSIYRDVAQKTAGYILREMTSPEGGFYSAQDADSEGVEGKYYLFETDEIMKLLGKQQGEAFNEYYDITPKGNFEGKNIPNLLKNNDLSKDFGEQQEILYQYRKRRYALHLDDKILTSWNSLMIAAMCHLYRITEDRIYLDTAVRAEEFVLKELCEDDTLYVSYREHIRGGKGFLDDYANQIFALLTLYGITMNSLYLEKAQLFCDKAVSDFYDKKQSGFFLYGEVNEQLILRPKETYDGAIPSGNSFMAYNLVQLYFLTGEKKYGELAEEQLAFMSGAVRYNPTSYAMYLIALSAYIDVPRVCQGEECSLILNIL